MHRLWISSDDLQRVEPGGEDGADAAGVDLAEDVSADQAKHRADVQARGATNALQRLLELRVVRHLGAAVVHQDDVQLLGRAVGVGHRAADDGDVAGEQLRRGAARQRGQDRNDVGELGHQLLDADDGDVNLGQRRDQARIAFVGDDDEAAGFGDGDVGAGDAHLGVEELGAQLAARELHQLGDVGRLALFDLVAEDVGDFFLGHVDGGHDHVRRRLSGQLNDPLAQVGFADFDAGFFQMRVEVNFLRRHRLRFDDVLTPFCLRQIEDVVADLGGIVGAKNFGAAGFGVAAVNRSASSSRCEAA